MRVKMGATGSAHVPEALGVLHLNRFVDVELSLTLRSFGVLRTPQDDNALFNSVSRAGYREEKPDRDWASIVRTWGAAVLRPYEEVADGANWARLNQNPAIWETIAGTG